MIALEVRLNNELISIAGHDDLSVLSTIISAVGVLGSTSAGTMTKNESYEISLNVTGLSAPIDESPTQHLAWIPRSELQLGDELFVRVVEIDRADDPSEINEQKSINLAEQERRSWELSRDEYYKYKLKYENDNS